MTVTATKERTAKERGAALMTSRTATLAAAAAAAGGATLLAGLVFFSGVILNPDVSIQLQAGEMLLEGNIPYVGYVELNPPLSHYVHTVPVLVAQLLGVGVPMTFQVIVLCVVGWSAAALYYIITRSKAIATRAGRLLVVAAWIAFSIVVFGMGDFGQREHLFMLAFGPWLYLREGRHRDVAFPLWLTLPAGIFGGFFILLKPHFLLIALVAEGWMLFRTRRWKTLLRAEIFPFVSIGVAYGVSLVAIAPLREAFFGRWLPFIAANYDVSNASYYDMLLEPMRFGMWLWVVIIGALGMAFLAARCAVGKTRRLDFEVLPLSILFGLVIYFIQHKGWPNHLFPAVASAVLLAAVAGVVLLEHTDHFTSISWMRGRVVLFGAIVAVLGLAYNAQVWKSIEMARSGHEAVDPFVEYMQAHTKKGGRVGFIDPAVLPAYPSITMAGRRPGGRHLQPFAIPMMYKEERDRRRRNQTVGPFPYRGPDELTKRERRFITELGQDVLKYKPPIIFIQSRFHCSRCPSGFDVHGYLRHAGWTEKYLKNYEPADVIWRHVVYQRVDL